MRFCGFLRKGADKRSDKKVKSKNFMALIPYKPFGDLEKWFEDDWTDFPERWFARTPEFKAPKMDIYEDKGNVVANVEIPGVDPKDIDVEIKNNVLKIEARTEEKKEDKGAGKGYYRKEISKGYYKRAVSLPVEVQEKKAEADFKEGILKIVIPKAEKGKGKDKPEKIKVKSSKEK